MYLLLSLFMELFVKLVRNKALLLVSGFIILLIFPDLPNNVHQ